MNSQRGKSLTEEGKFFDQEYQEFTDEELMMNPFMFNKYINPGPNPVDWREWSAVRMGNLEGKRVLDYGCGKGEEAVYFAKLGAQVEAIDISPVGIELGRKRSVVNHVADKINIKVMDAMNTTFDSESFDIIHGIGIIHHLDLHQCAREVHRLLKKGGKAIFLEPVENSRLMVSLKNMIPGKKMETTDFEQNLTYADLDIIGSYFREYSYWDFFLFARLRKLINHRAFVALTQSMDCALFKYIKYFRRFGSGVVLELQK